MEETEISCSHIFRSCFCELPAFPFSSVPQTSPLWQAELVHMKGILTLSFALAGSLPYRVSF
ncbi:hypothetical protein I33_3357 [Bacillus subtilis subsp. subtilis str. RO-NN-1]|nr:hypothetical protein I33_3357 [Bacillus subtilis subsp. subtilis str. RO-NN-1]